MIPSRSVGGSVWSRMLGMNLLSMSELYCTLYTPVLPAFTCTKREVTNTVGIHLRPCPFLSLPKFSKLRHNHHADHSYCYLYVVSVHSHTTSHQIITVTLTFLYSVIKLCQLVSLFIFRSFPMKRWTRELHYGQQSWFMLRM